MKRIITWIKHEYRIIKGLDRPISEDYWIISDLGFYVYGPLCGIVLSLFFLFYSGLDTIFIFFFLCISFLPYGWLLDINSNY